jgi:hypothetical protein
MEQNYIDVIAFCGLCCLDCHGYTGKIADLARDLRKELRAANMINLQNPFRPTPLQKHSGSIPSATNCSGRW